jgi:hypothetical protein
MRLEKEISETELCFLMPEFQGKQDFVLEHFRDFKFGISFGFFHVAATGLPC